MKPDRELVALLEKAGVPFELESGSRHIKVRVNGLLAGVLPHGKYSTANRRTVLNTITQMRRAAAGASGRRKQQ